MRDFLDAILDFISQESLSDDEWDAVPTDVAADYSVETYNALVDVLESRESASNALERLEAYFVARGTDVESGYTPKSNILIGGEL
jgi:hypothetical protein